MKNRRGNPNKPKDVVTAAQGRCYFLSMLGYSPAELAKMEGITERGIYSRIASARLAMNIDQNLILGTTKVYELVQKALKRAEDVLDNGTDKDALTAARMILDGAGLTKDKGKRYLAAPSDVTESDAALSNEEVFEEGMKAAARLMAYRDSQKEQLDNESKAVEADYEIDDKDVN